MAAKAPRATMDCWSGPSLVASASSSGSMSISGSKRLQSIHSSQIASTSAVQIGMSSASSPACRAASSVPVRSARARTGLTLRSDRPCQYRSATLWLRTASGTGSSAESRMPSSPCSFIAGACATTASRSASHAPAAESSSSPSPVSPRSISAWPARARSAVASTSGTASGYRLPSAALKRSCIWSRPRPSRSMKSSFAVSRVSARSAAGMSSACARTEGDRLGRQAMRSSSRRSSSSSGTTSSWARRSSSAAVAPESGPSGSCPPGEAVCSSRRAPRTQPPETSSSRAAVQPLPPWRAISASASRSARRNVS